MWAIINSVNGKINILGSWWTSPQDTLSCFFSLYRSPNQIIWKTKEPTQYLRDDINYDAGARLICFRKIMPRITQGQEEIDIAAAINGNSPYIVIDIHIAIVSKNWIEGRFKSDSYMEVKFIPDSISVLKNNTGAVVLGGKDYVLENSLSIIFRAMEVASNNPHFKIKEDSTTGDIKYKNFIGMNNPMDTIEKIAHDNQLEYFYDGKILRIGQLITNNSTGKDVSPMLKYDGGPDFMQTVFSCAFKYIAKSGLIPHREVMYSGAFPDTLPLPGTEIGFINVNSLTKDKAVGKRILYLNLNFSQKTGPSSIFVAGPGKFIPKSFLDSIIPDAGRNIQLLEVPSKYPSVIYGEILKNIDNPSPNDAGTNKETIRRQVNADLVYTHHNPENMDFTKSTKFTPIMFESTPYAGDEVGVQYPKNIYAQVIALAPDGKLDSATIVGQMFHKNVMPKRESENDYRLTLGDAATDYYSYENQGWLRYAANSTIIGADNTITSNTNLVITDEVPNLSSYINCRVDENNMGIIEMNVNPFVFIDIVENNSEDNPYILLQSEDNTLKLNSDGISLNDLSLNKLTMNTNGVILDDYINTNKLTMDNDGVNIVDTNDNDITMGTGGITISDSVNTSEISMGSAGITLDSGNTSTVMTGGTIVMGNTAIGVTGGAARKGDKVKIHILTDQKFLAAIKALVNAIKSPVPEPGNGVPSVLGQLISGLLSVMPDTFIGEIVEGSSKVKIQ